MYYRKAKGVYMGNYVPNNSVESAGFNTSAKSKATILAKLEEVLRNKQLLIYSSRFYEELKVFTVNESGKMGAKRGYNDDLVMSLAIGTWLFDASADRSKTSKVLNDQMLKAMAFKTKSYEETSSSIYNPIGVYSPNTSNTNRNTGNNIITDINKVNNRNIISGDNKWLL